MNSSKVICYHFVRRLKICVFDAEVELGECDICCIGAKAADYEDIIRKMNTWEEGDRRRIETIFPNGLELRIYPRQLTKAENMDLGTEEIITFHMPPQAKIPFPDVMKKYIIEY